MTRLDADFALLVVFAFLILQDQGVLNDLQAVHFNHGFEETPLLDVKLNPFWPPIHESPRR
jgi:hypothetical protein